MILYRYYSRYVGVMLVTLSYVNGHAQSFDLADSLWVKAEVAVKAGDFIKAARLYEQSANAEKRCAEPRQDKLYFQLRSASYNYHQANDIEYAFELRKASLEQSVKVFGTEHENYGLETGWVGWYYEQKGEYNQATLYYKEAHDNKEKALGKDHSEYGVSLNSLARVFEKLGQYEQALPLYQEALENAEKSLGKDHSWYGTYLTNLAGLYAIIGQYDQALPLYQKALENAEKSLGKDHSWYGTYLTNLAGLYERMGQYDKALPLFQEALENIEKSQGKDHSSYGFSLSYLATLYEGMGQYDKALPLFQEALEITEKSLGKDHSWYGAYLTNLGGLYEKMGQYDKALPLILEGLENTEKSQGKNHSSYGASLIVLAELYESMGQYDIALPLFLEGLENIEKSLGKDHYRYGNCLMGLAGLYESMGQYDNALPLYLAGLENFEKALGKDHYGYGNCLNNLALLYQFMGQYDKALPLYLEALENTGKSLGKDHSEYGTRLNNLARLYRSMGQYDKALPLYLEAKDNSYGQLGQAFSFMSEREKDQFMKTNVGYYYEVYQSFFTLYSYKKTDVGTHAYDLELATKGMILQSGIQIRQAILNNGDGNALARYDDWVTYRSILAKQYALPIVERRSDLKELEANAESLEGELARLSNTFQHASSINHVKWQDVQRGLKNNEVAIEFSSFQYRQYFRDQQSFDSTLYVAYVLRKGDTHPQLVYLCEQRQLDSLLLHPGSSEAGFITGLYRSAKVEGQTNVTSYGKRLYELIWKPLDGLLQEGSTIYFSPSGSLHQIAFAAIPYDETTLLSDRYRLRQLSSTAMVLQPSRFESTASSTIVMFGGIQYDVNTDEMVANAANVTMEDVNKVMRALPDNLDRGNTSWTYLPGTLKEVTSITTVARENRVNAQLYTGSNATEETFKQLAGKNSPRVLHISTHGFFFPDPKKEKPEEFNRLEEEKNVYQVSDNPLHRSGLLFAGSNRAWRREALPEGIDDGILTAYEASNVTLSNTQLVVLSACETGLGDIKGSEGVFGLQRSFRAAGAEYLMMSLWKVPDKETAEFMEYFYKGYFTGKDIPQAFEETQAHMKAIYPNDPYKWAAFVLVR